MHLQTCELVKGRWALRSDWQNDKITAADIKESDAAGASCGVLGGRTVVGLVLDATDSELSNALACALPTQMARTDFSRRTMAKNLDPVAYHRRSDSVDSSDVQTRRGNQPAMRDSRHRKTDRVCRDPSDDRAALPMVSVFARRTRCGCIVDDHSLSRRHE